MIGTRGNRLVIFVLISAAATSFIACGTMPLSDFAERNRDNLSNLTVGMPRHEAMRAMGSITIKTPESGWKVTNPHCTDRFAVEDRDVTTLYYVSGPFSADGAHPYEDALGLVFPQQQIVPVVFENDRLVGWGREYWDQYKASASLETGAGRCAAVIL